MDGTLVSSVLTELARNDVLSGLIGGSLFGSGLYLLRGLPAAAWEFVDWRMTCTLTVFSEDQAFERVNQWLSSLEYAKRSRRLRMTVDYDEERGETREVLAPGIGLHLIWYKRRPVLVERSLPDKGGIGSWKRFEDIRLRTFGSSPELLHDLIKSIQSARRRVQEKTVEVFLYRQRWRLACRKTKRDVDTVVLPTAQKSSLLADVQRFLDSRELYMKRGTPYRRGYLFEGPPGCGKTTLALALAGHFKRPIYALNLGSVGNDDDLIDAVCDVPEHGILLIEDIDAAEVGARQAKRPVAQTVNAAEQPKEPERRVTLSGLLNVLDGVFSRDGRILIMTTNYPERVDSALLRPGRADRRERIGELGEPEVLEMCRRFLPRDQAASFARKIQAPIAAADLQERLVRAAEAPTLRGVA